MSNHGEIGYLDEVMRGFEPQHDTDAAMKFALNVLLMDHRLADLRDMLSRDSEIGGVGGEPGWTIAYSTPKSAVVTPDASVIAEVEPEAFELAHPTTLMHRKDFLDLVAKAVDAYERRGPTQRAFAELPALKVALAEARRAATQIV